MACTLYLISHSYQINVFSFDRFDSTNRYINDPNVRLEFYASDEVKVGKKIVSICT